MELGISGCWAIVCASSKGLGKGCAAALAREGVNLVLNGRGSEALDAAAEEILSLNSSIIIRTVTGDVADADIRDALLAACPQVDILVNNAGGPPAGDFRDWDENTWHAALDRNMLAPIALMRATVDAMAERNFGRIVNITSGAVKSPIAMLGLSNGARSGLTGFVAGLARQAQLAGRNVTINNLLPGLFETDRLASMLQAPDGPSREQRLAAIPAGRFGSAEEFGALCAFLCSHHAGYMTGQNLLLDGGAYPGTF